jgi:hypothetical protein
VRQHRGPVYTEDDGGDDIYTTLQQTLGVNMADMVSVSLEKTSKDWLVPMAVPHARCSGRRIGRYLSISC